MSKEVKKALQSNQNKNISEMILKFQQCSEATTILANSIEKFTDAFTNIENNATKLERTEKKLNSNNYIKELSNLTDKINDTLNYFNDSIPNLSENMKSSKKELELLKNEFSSIINYFQELHNQIGKETENMKLVINDIYIMNKNILEELQDYIEQKSRKLNSNYKKREKKILEDMDKLIHSRLADSQKEILECINKDVDTIINNKINQVTKSVSNKNNYIEMYSIYDLYIRNNKKLPIDVVKQNWHGNFYFRVEKIKDNSSGVLMGYGNRYKDSELYGKFGISANLKEFRLYTYSDNNSIEDF